MTNAEEHIRSIRNAANRALNRLDDEDDTESSRDEHAALDELSIIENRLNEAKTELGKSGFGDRISRDEIVEVVQDVDGDGFEGLAESLENTSIGFKPEEFYSASTSNESVEIEDESVDDDFEWTLIGSEDKDKDTEVVAREYKEPEEETTSYRMLKALSYLPPTSLSDAIANTSFSENQVSSELHRLYKWKLLSRSKRPGFEDKYTYWFTYKGENLLKERGDWQMDEDDHDLHKDLRARFGE